MTGRIAAALVLVAVLVAGCGGSGDDATPPPDAAPDPTAFVREPYLTRVGETSARLRWIAR